MPSAPFAIHHIHSAYLRTSRRLTVFRPRTRGPHGPLPVLYMNDGQNLFEPERAFAGQTWRVAETIQALVHAHAIPPVLVAGIDHGGSARSREYLPVKDERHPHAGRPLGRQYAAFVAREVVPFVERQYPAIRRASARGFGGSSYGAIAVLLAAMEAPGLFGRLLIESPSLYVGRGYMLRRARRVQRWPSRVYLGVGTAETEREDVNRETVENVRRLAAILRAAGLGARRLLAVEEEGGTHSEEAWARRFSRAVAFLFG